MNTTTQFEVISSLRDLLPGIFTLAVMHFSPIPRQASVRALVSILVAWSGLVLYTVLIYNPAGIAAGLEAGQHFSENRFDNNTASTAILGGWLIPAAVICIYFLGRRSMTGRRDR